jgi:hypothetical protein
VLHESGTFVWLTEAGVALFARGTSIARQYTQPISLQSFAA